MNLASTARTMDRHGLQDPGEQAEEATAATAADADRPTTTTEGAGATAASGIPAVVHRRLAPLDAHLEAYSWLATAFVTVIAAVLRFAGLAAPEGKIFDEVYYATDAHNLLTRGFEWDEKNNTAGFVVHPPLGKWLIALGEWAFGYNEFGWRVSAAVVGTLSVLILVRVARRMFGSTVLGCTAGLLMAVDGFHLVLSRTALLDIFLLFFVLAAFAALVRDRDARRQRWLRAMRAGLDPSRPGRAGRPRFTLRDSVPWWRLLAGVLLGCATAVKWSGLAFVPLFVLLIVLWEVGARRSAGVRKPWRDTLLDETGWIALFGVLVIAVYLASWSGWFLTDGGYYRHHLRNDLGSSEPPVLGALINLWDYHQQALNFHLGLNAKHTYQSWPWQWLLLGRPVAFYWSGDGPCGATNCAAEVLLLGTPILWWSFLPALAALTWLGIARRDWRAGAILGVVAMALLPWFYIALDDRTMFSFYAAPALPFLVLAVVYVLGAIMVSGKPATNGPDRAGRASDRRLIGAVIAGAYVLLVLTCFAYFYPIFIGQTIPYADWSARMWLGSRWI